MPEPTCPAVPKLLAFDTSTEALSVAVRHGETLFEHQGAGAAAASATLIPTIHRLMAEAGLAFAELDAIAFGRGPGAFTGLRTACAVAQGLGFGARVQLLPIDTLHAVAEEARHRFGSRRVLALLDARMDQVYAARYDFDRPDEAAAEPMLLAPEAVALPLDEAASDWVLAGNAFAVYGDRLSPECPRHEVLPTAAAMLRLAPSMLARGQAVDPALAWPRYVRDKVAQTTQERAALKAAAAPVA